MKTYQQKGSTDLLIINHRTSKKVLLNNVVFLKAEVNYTIVHLQDGREKLVAHTIKFFEKYLATHGFLRVHRSYLVNPNHIKKYDQDQELLMMSNGTTANIARRRRRIVKCFCGG